MEHTGAVVSETLSWHERLRALRERLGITRYDCLQPRYNLLYRDIETELLPLCRSQGVGVIVYNPLAGGFLSGKYRKGEKWEYVEPAEFKM